MRGLTRRKGGGEGVLLLWVLAAGVTANAPAYKVGARRESKQSVGHVFAVLPISHLFIYIHYTMHTYKPALTSKLQPPAYISLQQRWAVRKKRSANSKSANFLRLVDLLQMWQFADM
jgi:hypothetical protein